MTHACTKYYITACGPGPRSARDTIDSQEEPVQQTPHSRHSVAVAARLLITASALLLLTAPGHAREMDVSTGFYVLGGDAIEPSCEQANIREVAVACHRIKSGDATVIAIREYSRRMGDNSRFRKITVVLHSEKISEGTRIDLASGGNKVFYSTGLSHMPGNAGCYGTSSSGHILVEKIRKRKMVLRMESSLDLSSTAGSVGACTRRVYKATITARERRLADLGPWEGVPGGASYVDEGIPD